MFFTRNLRGSDEDADFPSILGCKHKLKVKCYDVDVFLPHSPMVHVLEASFSCSGLSLLEVGPSGYP
jgi:hypothetical protein